jgi:cytochrome P450
MGVLFAGFETTANTIAWSLYHLTTLEDVRQAVVSEIEAQLAGRTIDELTADDLKHCPLVSAVGNESLRLHAPAPGHVGDVVPREGATVGGVFLPHATPIYAMYSAYYVQEHFFDHASTFDPQRWIDGRVDARADQLGIPKSEFFAPFLLGPHVCLGKTLAETELHVALALAVSLQLHFSRQAATQGHDERCHGCRCCASFPRTAHSCVGCVRQHKRRTVSKS